MSGRVRFGSKAVKLDRSKCFPLHYQKATSVTYDASAHRQHLLHRLQLGFGQKAEIALVADGGFQADARRHKQIGAPLSRIALAARRNA